MNWSKSGQSVVKRHPRLVMEFRLCFFCSLMSLFHFSHAFNAASTIIPLAARQKGALFAPIPTMTVVNRIPRFCLHCMSNDRDLAPKETTLNSESETTIREAVSTVSEIEKSVRKDNDMLKEAKLPSSLLQNLAAQTGSRRIMRSSISPAELAEMASKAASSNPEIAQNRRRKLALAIASPILAACLFFGGRSMPTDPLTLLRALESKSPPLEVALTNGKPVVVEFFAKWCGDCKAMAPSMVQLEKVYGQGKVNFVVIDAEKDANADLVNKFRVDAIPHFAFVDSHRQLRTTITGYLPKGVMQRQLDALATDQNPLPYCGPDLCGLDPNSNSFYFQAGSRL